MAPAKYLQRLKPKHHMAINLLLMGKERQEVAAQLKTHPTMVDKWKMSPVFREELERKRKIRDDMVLELSVLENAGDAVKLELSRLGKKSLEVIENTLDANEVTVEDGRRAKVAFEALRLIKALAQRKKTEHEGGALSEAAMRRLRDGMKQEGPPPAQFHPQPPGARTHTLPPQAEEEKAGLKKLFRTADGANADNEPRKETDNGEHQAGRGVAAQEGVAG